MGMLFSSIDIGSNAVRLLFANVYESEKGAALDKATLMRIPIRLGMDVFNLGYITPERAENLAKTIQAFKILIDVYKPISYRAAATSAMRDAANGADILRQIREETGVEVEIIDGLEEAGIVGKLNNLFFNSSRKRTIYVDVGGGSTEISVFDGTKFVTSNSFQIGTIRLLANRVEKSEWRQLENWLAECNNCKGNVNFIGSGGNINKLSKLYGDLQTNTITRQQLQAGYNQLSHMTVSERITRFGMRPDRADVIVPAAKIFLNIMKWLDLDVIFTPRVGLADGLVLEQYHNYRNGK